MDVRSAPRKRVPEPEGEPELGTELEVDKHNSKRRNVEIGSTHQGHQGHVENDENASQDGDPREDL